MGKIFGRGLKRMREQQGLKQESLAQQAGYVSHSQITKIETGRTVPSLEKAMRLAEIFHVPLEAFFAIGRGAPWPPETVTSPLRAVIATHCEQGITKIAEGLQDIAQASHLIGAQIPDVIPLEKASKSQSNYSRREDWFPLRHAIFLRRSAPLRLLASSCPLI